MPEMRRKTSSIPTIHDVAKKAGVSISTVSRVVTRNVPVSDEVAARVEAAMKELKYVPRAAADETSLLAAIYNTAHGGKP